VEELIKENGFTFTVEQMFNFIRACISLREKSKFEFTKTVSDILKLVQELGEEHEFTAEEMAFLDIEQVRHWASKNSGEGMKQLLGREIDRGRNWYNSARMIKIPHLIFGPDDLFVLVQDIGRPNFVTLRKVTGLIVKIIPEMIPSEIKGKIVLIEGADPGYDWVFMHDIQGLITKYGGAASHMTIRAVEFGVPAAIGCGEILYEKLSKATSVELDCIGKQIHAM
jgi:hypothetical protein